MALIQFQDLPSTNTPINANNLNNNFNELYNSMFYKNGDTYSATSITPSNGWITGSSKNITCVLTLPKKLTNITSITVNSYDITARQVQGGYALSRVTTGLTVTVTKLDDVNISISIVSDTAFSATNNTPISVSFYGLNLTFNT